MVFSMELMIFCCENRIEMIYLLILIRLYMFLSKAYLGGKITLQENFEKKFILFLHVHFT